MRVEHMADFLEKMNEYLASHHFSWWLSEGQYKSKEIEREVKEFVTFCMEENLKDLHEPRGWKKKSYIDYRREAMEHAGEVVNETKTANSAC